MHSLKTHPRFFYSIIFAILTYALLSFTNTSFNILEKILISFNLYLWAYVFQLFLMIFKTEVERIKSFALSQDEQPIFLIITSIVSAIIALIAIAFEFSKSHDLHGSDKLIHLILPTTTLIGAWLLIPTLFAVHYAHLYYSNKNETHKIIRFPEDPLHPDYIDFLYFSITISAAAQTADVSVTNKHGRRLVLLQTLVAFAFNTSILALGINVAASLLN